jgi:hypothetical protein
MPPMPFRRKKPYRVDAYSVVLSWVHRGDIKRSDFVREVYQIRGGCCNRSSIRLDPSEPQSLPSTAVIEPKDWFEREEA